MKKEVLRYENVHCIEDNRVCINGFFFRAFQGEICGVMVNNMREKEYFLRFLRGKMKPTYGWIYFEENKIVSERAHEHMQSQIGFIGLHHGIFDELSVEENVFVAGQKVQWMKLVKDLCKDAAEFFQNLEVDIPIERKAYMLDPGLQKQVELLRAYVAGCKVVVIADVGMVMTDGQLKDFFRLVSKLKKRGMSFIYIANNSTRLFDFADTITVLKNGRTIGYMNRENFSRSQIYIQLFGPTVRNGYLENTLAENKRDTKKVLEFKNVKLRDLPELNVSLNAGEVLNILDRDSMDCRNILEILQGEHKIDSGSIFVSGQRYNFSSAHRSIRDGIAFIESRPIEQMLFMEMSVVDNLILMLSYRKKGVFARKKYKRMIQNLLLDVFTEKELKEKTYAVSDECRMKLLYYRWILTKPKILVCVRPFVSADFRMRQLTVNLLQEVLKVGISVIIITTQMAEAYTMEGQNVTFHNGKIEIDWNTGKKIDS